MRLLLLLLLTLNLLNAQKIALLIGNSNYQHLDRLTSPSQDIPALARKLRGMNFKVTELYDLDEKKMKKAIKTFKQKLYQNPNAIALFYYSGHGSQAYGESYLIPVDGDTRDEADVEADGVKVETIARKMANANTKANILFLDACRDVPTGTMGNGTKGLGQVKHRPSGSLIVYSTSKNTTAKDDRLFNKVVLQKLGMRISLTTLANDISYTVDQKTDGSQVPEVFAKSLPTLCLTGSCANNEVKVVEKIVYRDPPKTATQTRRVDSSTNTSKWITPTNSVCKVNGGEIYKGICQAKWSNAKKICSQSGGHLPSREDLKQVVVDCGGIVNSDWFGKDSEKNRKNSSYQSCYKGKGFSNHDWYWTREEKDSSYAWRVGFNGGVDSWYFKTGNLYALCVR